MSHAPMDDWRDLNRRGTNNQFLLLAATVVVMVGAAPLLREAIGVPEASRNLSGIVGGMATTLWGLLVPRIMRKLGRDDGLSLADREVRRSIVYSIRIGSGIFGANGSSTLASFLSWVWKIDIESGPPPQIIRFFPIDFLARAIVLIGMVNVLIFATLMILGSLGLKS